MCMFTHTGCTSSFNSLLFIIFHCIGRWLYKICGVWMPKTCCWGALLRLIFPTGRKSSLYCDSVHNCVISPLDELIDQLGGPGNVAEMTGRKGRLVRAKGNGDRVHYELRDKESCTLESLNNNEVGGFTITLV